MSFRNTSYRSCNNNLHRPHQNSSKISNDSHTCFHVFSHTFVPPTVWVWGDLGMEQEKTQEEERKEEEPARFHLERPKKSDSSTPTKEKVEKLFAIRGLLSRSHRLSVLLNLWLLVSQFCLKSRHDLEYIIVRLLCTLGLLRHHPIKFRNLIKYNYYALHYSFLCTERCCTWTS